MENTRCRVRVAARWLAVAAYAGLLFFLSSLRQPIPFRLTVSDKFLHLIIYAGFGSLLVWACQPINRNWGAGRTVAVAGLGGFVYGLTDEFHQRFVSGRTPDFADLAFDVIGSVFGGMCYLLLAYVLRSCRKGKIETDDSAVASV